MELQRRAIREGLPAQVYVSSIIQALFLFMFLCWIPAAGAADPDIHGQLKKALTCQGNPLESVRKIAQHGSRSYQSGYAGSHFGQELQYTSLVLLRTPVVIAGAKAYSVVAGTIQYYEDFGGIVHARFTGDYKKVVAALGLAPHKKGKSFYKKTGIDLFGKPDHLCPMTIELKPLEDGSFVLGCGWCNG